MISAGRVGSRAKKLGFLGSWWHEWASRVLNIKNEMNTGASHVDGVCNQCFPNFTTTEMDFKCMSCWPHISCKLRLPLMRTNVRNLLRLPWI